MQEQTYHLEIKLRGLPKTINQMGRAHWAIRAREARNWRTLVALATMGKRPKKPLGKAKITMTRFSSRELDHDNLAHSFKPVLDGLIDGGVILDDSPFHIGVPKYKPGKAKRGEGYIKIQVKEVPCISSS